MAENHKYYYLKLKEDFFESDEIRLLRNMADGVYYVNILLWIYLKSLKSNGRLLLNGRIPFTVETIATLSGNQVGTVERAMKAYLALGLVELLKDESFYICNIELLVGKSSTEGERKKTSRLRLKEQNLLIEN